MKSSLIKRIIYVAFWLVVDIILINLAIYGAYLLRFDAKVPEEVLTHYKNSFVIITAVKIAIFTYFGLYKSLWRYASIRDVINITGAVVIANVSMMAFVFLTKEFVPRSIYIITCILDIGFIGGSRLMYRIIRKHVKDKNSLVRVNLSKKKTRVLIFGAGDAGVNVLRELRNHAELNSIPVAFVDDDHNKVGTKINGVTVMGTRKELAEIVLKKGIDEIIIAMPSENRKNIRDIIEECNKTHCKLKILPGVYELINGNVSIKSLRDVNIEDLLGRDAVKTNIEGITGYLKDNTVLVTGGGGSIGSELCRQIAGFSPKQLLILDIYENNAYDLQNELINKYPDLDLKVLIASVRDKARLESIFNKYKPDVVFHAAAHKHVPLMEDNPTEAIKNNVFGTLNVVDCAHNYKVKKFVLISTDKAVNPTNIMGATKRAAEMIIQSYSRYSKTVFTAVRFGNVLGSNGSVIPLFRKQIVSGGPVTVTHENITRYFMTIPEAVQLVIQAGSMSNGGEIYVLDMGEPVKIMDLAVDLIRLSGFEPYEDIDIKITGLRPGEKMYEELFMKEEELNKTSHERIFIGKPVFKDQETLLKELNNLKAVILKDEEDAICAQMENFVGTYRRSKVV